MTGILYVLVKGSKIGVTLSLQGWQQHFHTENMYAIQQKRERGGVFK
jgi:hypothetical protein